MLHAGCSGVCQGPACEASWAAARLSLLDPDPNGGSAWPEALDPIRDATGVWTGGLDDGSDWSTAFLGSRVVVGLPEDERVVIVEDPGFLRESQLVEWSSSSRDFGASVLVHTVGDRRDLWVGAPAHDGTRGAFYVYRDAEGHAGGAEDVADVVVSGPAPAAALGTHITSCGDLTGDGVDDLLVGVPLFTVRAEDWSLGEVDDLAGAAFLVESEKIPDAGEVDLLSLGRVWWGESVGAGAGSAIACDRDVYIGAPWHLGTQGKAYRLRGEALPASGPLSQIPAADTIAGINGDDWLGTSLAVLELGDQRGFAVGSAGHEEGQGRAQVFVIDEAGAAVEIAAVFPDRNHPYRDHFGRTLLAADIDGDGIDDLVVGSPDHRTDSNGFDTGQVWIWSGADHAVWPSVLWAETADHVLVGTHPFQRVGRHLAAGDPDEDGFDALLLPTRAASVLP